MDQNYSVNTNNTNDEIEIDIMEIIMVLMRWIWVIGAAAIVGGLIMFIYSKVFITPTFESTTRIVVLNTESSDTLTYTDLQVGTPVSYTHLTLPTMAVV